MEDGVGLMGMYGMGGVGKTTLLTQINNEFSKNKRGFDYVIWVVVSKELQMEKIRDDIAQKVGLVEEEWKEKDKSEKTVHLYNFLRKKNFVLFLDDIWEKVDLAEIGVPFPTRQNRCKVVFTTRSHEVCARMGVEKPMEVQCLMENDAFDLFQKKIGETTLGSDPGIPELARIIAKKCCGLPLALNVIGETMSCKKTVQEWRNTRVDMNSYAAEFDGMENKILPLLKYSYDSLKGEHVKLCLLYCALFPEDARIPKESLIEYWICEGIIDGNEGIERAEDKGYGIIGSLVHASLLMEAVDDHDGKSFVTMHDVVREMALWIASELGIQKEAFIVRAGVWLREIPKVENWNVVRRMSLMENKIEHLVSSHECMELTTLLVRNTWLANISSEFFKHMPKLVVLDLSGNPYLYHLPEGVSNLVSLQYINLKSTGIRHFPGLQELKKLMHLDLEKTHLRNIAGISRLHNLKILKLAGYCFSWDLAIVKELETLEHLEILTTTIDPNRGSEQYVSSHRVMSRTRYLKISGKFELLRRRCLQSFEISLPESTDKLREFRIEHCNISEIKIVRICSFLSLVDVFIDVVDGLRELTFLMFAPNLRCLVVENAVDLQDIINKEKACQVEFSRIVPFQKLKKLRLLEYLPKLTNIYWSPLPFPCLEEIDIGWCENLRKLPLDSKSGKHGCIIKYEDEEWIEGVEWVDEATRTRFLSSSRLKEQPCSQTEI